MKRAISLLLSLILAFSVLSPCFAANALDGETINIKINGTQLNETVKTAADSINAERKAQGAKELVFDKHLTKVARMCAVKAMIYTDSEFNLPTGKPLSLLVPEIGQSASAFRRVIKDVSLQTVTENLKDILSKNSAVVCIGAAVFTCNAETVMFVLTSTVPEGETETDFPTQIYNGRESICISYLNSGTINFSPVKYGKYKLSMQVTCSGFCGDYFDVADADITYRSSNANILKIKGKNGYVKNNGEVIVTSYSNMGTLLIQGKIPCTRTPYKPEISYLKSKKKKQATVKWTKNITNANGYQIQYSESKKFKTVKTVTVKGNKYAKTLKKLKSGKTYYFRVRAYIDQGEQEKMFTPWGKKKKIVIK